MVAEIRNSLFGDLYAAQYVEVTTDGLAKLSLDRTQCQALYRLLARALNYPKLPAKLRSAYVGLQRLVMAAGLYADPALFDLPEPDGGDPEAFTQQVLKIAGLAPSLPANRRLLRPTAIPDEIG